MHDLVIIGGGPSGLALAQCMLHDTKIRKIRIIERESDIGGCHRVERVSKSQLFTEHGPRVYSSAYLVFQQLLEEMDISYTDYFTPYKFKIAEIGGQTVFSTLRWRELGLMTLEFSKLVVNKNHGRNQVLLDYLTRHQFADKSIELINRLCALTDGGGADKYTLNEFLQLFNQQLFYTLYQPKTPNDVGLFTLWRNYLLQSGRVEFLINTDVRKLSVNQATHKIDSITISQNNEVISMNITPDTRVVLAIPPKAFLPIFNNSAPLIKNSFGDYNAFIEYVNNTAYIDYISITFHWHKQLQLDKVYGFPNSEWGIAFIVLTDYMKFEQKQSKTVISAAITLTDRISSHIDKTANQCTDTKELIDETLAQLRLAFPSLPVPDVMLISPGVYYDETLKKYRCKDTAFISTSGNPFMPYQSSSIRNLYTVGTHTGKHTYSFTSMESAVSNSVALAHIFHPPNKEYYKLKSVVTFAEIVRLLIFLSIIGCIFYFIWVKI
jgi:hypothetical protein